MATRASMKGKPRGPRWTKKEDWVLLRTLEEAKPLEVYLKRLPRRTVDAIHKRITTITRKRGFWPACLTLNKLEEQLGYNRDILMRVRDKLGQTWDRTSKARKSRWLISLKQVSDIENYLKTHQVLYVTDKLEAMWRRQKAA